MSSQVPTVQEIAGMSPAELELLARGLDRERRQIEAALATLVDRVGSACAFGADGHRSLKAWGRATCNWSGGEAARFVKTGRMLARFESAATAAANGELGVAQMHALGQLVGNPRVAEHLAASEELLVSQAAILASQCANKVM